MNKSLICLCGKESFVTGSDHISGKDGLWTVLCWLSILAERAVQNSIEEHWNVFGRNYFTRYDYENCLSENCNNMMDYLKEQANQGSLVGKMFEGTKYGDDSGKVHKIIEMDYFQYLDPVDGNSTKNQGIRIIFEDTSKIIVRLSGTGSSGASVCFHVESLITDLTKSTDVILKSLMKIALELTKFQDFAVHNQPITAMT